MVRLESAPVPDGRRARGDSRAHGAGPPFSRQATPGPGLLRKRRWAPTAPSVTSLGTALRRLILPLGAQADQPPPAPAPALPAGWGVPWDVRADPDFLPVKSPSQPLTVSGRAWGAEVPLSQAE